MKRKSSRCCFNICCSFFFLFYAVPPPLSAFPVADVTSLSLLTLLAYSVCSAFSADRVVW